MNLLDGLPVRSPLPALQPFVMTSAAKAAEQSAAVLSETTRLVAADAVDSVSIAQVRSGAKGAHCAEAEKEAMADPVHVRPANSAMTTALVEAPSPATTSVTTKEDESAAAAAAAAAVAAAAAPPSKADVALSDCGAQASGKAVMMASGAPEQDASPKVEIWKPAAGAAERAASAASARRAAMAILCAEGEREGCARLRAVRCALAVAAEQSPVTSHQSPAEGRLEGLWALSLVPGAQEDPPSVVRAAIESERSAGCKPTDIVFTCRYRAVL